MNKHNKHSHCEHDLKYCGHCDVAYCTKCQREWRNHIPSWHVYGLGGYTTSGSTYTINLANDLTSTGDGTGTLVQSDFTRLDHLHQGV